MRGFSLLVLIRIWIGEAQRCKRFHLQRLHRGGARIVHMVITDEVERPVDDQVRRMILQRNPLFFGLARAGFARQHDVAEQDFAVVAVREADEKIGDACPVAPIMYYAHSIVASKKFKSFKFDAARRNHMGVAELA